MYINRASGNVLTLSTSRGMFFYDAEKQSHLFCAEAEIVVSRAARQEATEYVVAGIPNNYGDDPVLKSFVQGFVDQDDFDIADFKNLEVHSRETSHTDDVLLYVLDQYIKSKHEGNIMSINRNHEHSNIRSAENTQLDTNTNRRIQGPGHLNNQQQHMFGPNYAANPFMPHMYPGVPYSGNYTEQLLPSGNLVDSIDVYLNMNNKDEYDVTLSSVSDIIAAGLGSFVQRVSIRHSGVVFVKMTSSPQVLISYPSGYDQMVLHNTAIAEILMGLVSAPEGTDDDILALSEAVDGILKLARERQIPDDEPTNE